MALKNFLDNLMKKKQPTVSDIKEIKSLSAGNFKTRKLLQKDNNFFRKSHAENISNTLKIIGYTKDIKSSFLGQLFYPENKKKFSINFLIIIEHMFSIYLSAFMELSSEEIQKTRVLLAKEEARKQKQSAMGIITTPLKLSPGKRIKTGLSENYTLKNLFKIMLKVKASDLHISIGLSPKFRIKGELAETALAAVTKEKSRQLIYQILSKKQIDLFDKELELDFTYEVSELARFRSNILKEYSGVGGVFRIIPPDIPSMEELGLPPVLKNIASYKQGLIIVTGPAGSGKTTSMASLLDYINSTKSANILTIESPLEFIHKNKKSRISYREVGIHTTNFPEAVRAARREDLDIIMVGEMTDRDTLLEAIQAADMGNLVLGIMNTTGVTRTVEKIIETFPGQIQGQVRSMLSSALRAIIAQQLIPTMDRKSRCPVVEVAITNQTLSNMIRDGKTKMINSVIHSSRETGMQSIDLALLQLVRDSKIDEESARLRSSSPRSFTVPVEFKPQDKDSI